MTDTSMYRAVSNMSAADDSARRISRGKKYREDKEDPPFSKQPDKEVDGHRFQNVDPKKEWDSVPSNALKKYDKKHYDGGGDYDHFDDKGRYWRLQKEKPTS